MPDPTHITVTAPPDRVTPVHKDDGIEPGGVQMRVTAEVVARVRYRGSQNVRRSIARGDLIPCDMSGSAVPSVDLAAAPEELSGGTMVKVIKEIGRALAIQSDGAVTYVHNIALPPEER